MNRFFDPNNLSSPLFAMGSAGHLALNAAMAVLLLLMVAARRRLGALRRSQSFMAGSAGVVLALEATSYVLKFVYPIADTWERLPLQLCSTLKIIMAVLVLLRRYEWLRYFNVLAMGCGVISMANLNLHGESLGNFGFWHYVIGHAYLLLLPMFLFLTGERVERREHLTMQAGLAVWSFALFLVNWAFDTNYMYTGPHSDTVVPIFPASWMQWPFNYLSFVGIALVLLNGTYLGVRAWQRRLLGDGPQPERAHEPAPQFAQTPVT